MFVDFTKIVERIWSDLTTKYVLFTENPAINLQQYV